MNYKPPGTLRVLRLLALTSVRRLLRAAKIQRQKRAQKGHDREKQKLLTGKAKKRKATSRKRGDGLMWLMLLMTPIFIFQGMIIAGGAAQKFRVAAEKTAPGGKKMWLPREVYWEVVGNHGFDEAHLVETLEDYDVDEASRPTRTQILEHWREHQEDCFKPDNKGTHPRPLMPKVEWQSDEARTMFVKVGALLLLALTIMMMAVVMGGANAALSGGEWTQAWLMSFPVATRSLVVARALEYSLVQFFPWFTIWPLSFQWLRALGEPHAIWISLLVTLVTTFSIGSIRLWLETSLRLRLTLHGLKNVQGCCTMLSLVMMALVFGVTLGPGLPFVFIDVCSAMPMAITLLPCSWPLGISTFGWLALVVGLLMTVTVFGAALFNTSRQLRGGIMRSGGVDSGSRGKSFNWKRHAKRLGVAGKELLMLRRDRNFMVQTLLVPIFVVGMQLIVNPSLGKAEGVGVVMIAYFVGLYGCLGGCFQVLSGEGRALWMLYSLPVSIADVLRRKTRIWASLALTFGVVALLAFSFYGARHPVDVLVDLVFLAIGIWSVAHIAAGIGVLGANPNADHIPKQPKPRHIYLFLLFGSTYFAVLWVEDPMGRLAGVLTFVTLAYAIWQRACERVQWLLDPVDEPRDHISLFDGGAAVLIFYASVTVVVQIMRLVSRGEEAALVHVNLAFAICGAVTAAIFSLLLWWRGVKVTRSLGFVAKGRPALLACLVAIGVGVGLGLLGLGYVHLVKQMQWFELPATPASDYAQMLLLACVAAPFIEEVLFRGLVLTGLLRSVSVPVAVVWSALLFALMHPSHSWPPVFLLGIATALLYRRSGFLPASMLLHATYNYVVVAYQ